MYFKVCAEVPVETLNVRVMDNTVWVEGNISPESFRMVIGLLDDIYNDLQNNTNDTKEG